MRFFRRCISMLSSAIAATTLATTAYTATPTSTLRVGLVAAENGSLDAPLLSYSDSINLSRLFLEPLYDLAPDGTLVPRLAASQPTVAHNCRRIMITLRNARWSNGAPITGSDVATSINRARSTAHGSFFASFLTAISRVSSPTLQSVRIDLKRTDPTVLRLLQSQLFTPTPSVAVKRHGASWWKSTDAAWSGPYAITSRGSRTIEATRNPRYAIARPKRPARVTVTFTTAAAVRAGLRAGTFDISVQNALGQDEATMGTPLTTTRSAPMASQYLYLNTTSPRLQDSHVRRAIALAVNRASIASTMHGTPLNAILPSTVPGSTDSTSGPRLLSADGTPNVTAASNELASSTWSNTTILRLVYNAGSNNATKVAQSVQSSLADIGIHVTLAPTSTSQISTVGTGISPIKAANDMLLQGWIVDYPDPYDWYQLFMCASVNAGLNASNYCDRSYDAVAKPTTSSLAWPNRIAAFQQLEQKLTGPAGSMPAVPLYQPSDRMDVNDRVLGLRVATDGMIHWDELSLARFTAAR